MTTVQRLSILNSDKTTESSDKTTAHGEEYGSARAGYHRVGTGGLADLVGPGDGHDPAVDRRLVSAGEAAQYATVQKLLDRMEAKGYVRRDRTMFVHVFRSVLDRDELIGRRLRSLAEMLCDGSLTPLLTHLARANDLTDEDRLALRAIVDETDPRSTVDRHGPQSRASLQKHHGRPALARRATGEEVPAADDDHEHRAEADLSWNRSCTPCLATRWPRRSWRWWRRVLGRICRRPALTHSLWLLVMLKLVTPPLVPVSLPAAMRYAPVDSSPAIDLIIDRDHGPAACGRTAAGASVRVRPHQASSDRIRRYRAPVSPAKPRRISTGSDSDPQSASLPEAKQAPLSVLAIGWSWEQLLLVVVLSGALGLVVARDGPDHPVSASAQGRAARAGGVASSRTNDLAGQVGLGRRPTVCLVPGRVPPMLWAIGGRPRLLVPSQLWATMSEDERTSLLLHELAHLKRRDHWVRWLELIVAGLYWWHPVVWWARRCLARGRGTVLRRLGRLGHAPASSEPTQPPCWRPLNLSRVPQPPRPPRRPPAEAGMFPA